MFPANLNLKKYNNNNNLLSKSPLSVVTSSTINVEKTTRLFGLNSSLLDGVITKSTGQLLTPTQSEKIKGTLSILTNALHELVELFTDR